MRSLCDRLTDPDLPFALQDCRLIIAGNWPLPGVRTVSWRAGAAGPHEYLATIGKRYIPAVCLACGFTKLVFALVAPDNNLCTDRQRVPV